MLRIKINVYMEKRYLTERERERPTVIAEEIRWGEHEQKGRVLLGDEETWSSNWWGGSGTDVV